MGFGGGTGQGGWEDGEIGEEVREGEGEGGRRGRVEREGGGGVLTTSGVMREKDG
jgi:hypothetical protein